MHPNVDYAQSLRKIGGEERLCSRHEGFGSAGFRTEREGVTKGGQDPYATGGKSLRRGKSVGHRQLQHQIGTTKDSRLCPESFVEDCRRAPLNEVTAHETHDGAIFANYPANNAQLLLVAQMKRVIFADDAHGLQKNPSFSQKFSIQGLRISKIYYRMSLVMAIIPQTSKKENTIFRRQPQMNILIINAGSSSLKYQLMDPETGVVSAI